MPTTVVSAVIFVMLAAPGVAWKRARARHVPSPTQSAFRELTAVILGSSLALGAVVGVLVMLAWFGVLDLPAVLSVVRSGEVRNDDEAASLAGWLTVVVVLATLLADRAARILPAQSFHEIREVSGWWEAFYADLPTPWADVHVVCNLVDGSLISGTLYRFNTDVTEGDDRDLTLAEPILYRPPGGQEATELKQSRAIVSSRQISSMVFEYVVDERSTTQSD